MTQQMHQSRGGHLYLRLGLLVAGLALALSLGGCWTVYKSDEDASQKRDGVNVNALDIYNAATQRPP